MPSFLYLFKGSTSVLRNSYKVKKQLNNVEYVLALNNQDWHLAFTSFTSNCFLYVKKTDLLFNCSELKPSLPFLIAVEKYKHQLTEGFSSKDEVVELFSLHVKPYLH